MQTNDAKEATREPSKLGQVFAGMIAQCDAKPTFDENGRRNGTMFTPRRRPRRIERKRTLVRGVHRQVRAARGSKTTSRVARRRAASRSSCSSSGSSDPGGSDGPGGAGHSYQFEPAGGAQ